VLFERPSDGVVQLGPAARSADVRVRDGDFRDGVVSDAVVAVVFDVVFFKAVRLSEVDADRDPLAVLLRFGWRFFGRDQVTEGVYAVGTPGVG
jgi:hypothetical protein